MEVVIAWQDMVDLKEVVGWDPENFDQGVLNRLRHFPETGLVIAAFEHVDFCERHVVMSPVKCRPGPGAAGF